MHRRPTLAVLAAAASTLAGSLRPGVVRAAAGDSGDGNGDDALQGTKSYLIHAGPGGSRGRVAHRPGLFLFTASAYKTFVLGQYLRDVEAGRLAEDDPGGSDWRLRFVPGIAQAPDLHTCSDRDRRRAR